MPFYILSSCYSFLAKWNINSMCAKACEISVVHEGWSQPAFIYWNPWKCTLNKDKESNFTQTNTQKNSTLLSQAACIKVGLVQPVVRKLLQAFYAVYWASWSSCVHKKQVYKLRTVKWEIACTFAHWKSS